MTAGRITHEPPRPSAATRDGADATRLHGRRGVWVEWAAAAAILVVVFVAGSAVMDGRRVLTDTDLAVYSRVVEGTDSYYDDMEITLENVGEGPASTLRAYRLPTLFWTWRVTGSFSWTGVVIVLVVSAAIVGVLVRPLAGAAVGAWLLLMTHELGAGVVVDRWGWVEYWTLPFVLGALLAVRWRRWTVAMCLVLVAALCRELAAPVLLTGAIGAWVAGQLVWPWLVGAMTWVVFFTWHALQVLPRLAERGFEKPLIDPGGLSGVLSQSGAFAGAAGLLLIGYVIWTRRWTAAWFVALPLVAGIPMVGFVTDRNYWSILVLPVAVALVGFPASARGNATRSMRPRSERRSGSFDGRQ